MRPDDPVLRRIREWAARQDAIRVVILTSSRARDAGGTDRFSDYDIMLFSIEPAALAAGSAWLEAFGRVLVSFQDEVQDGYASYVIRMVLFEDGTKIDFALTAVDLIERIVSDERLPSMLDVGYRVLLDKDGVTDRLPPPTGTAHVPRQPTEREFTELVQEFWWETTYVAKNLWRDELLPAKYSLECVITFDVLRRLLEWRVESDHGWRLRPGVKGRGFKDWLDPVTWAELAATFTGPTIEDTWDALFRTTRLFRRIAIDVADRLGLSYPHDLDGRVTVYLESVRQSPRPPTRGSRP